MLGKTLLGLLVVIVCLSGVPAVNADCNSDYIVPGRAAMFEGSLSGLREAYQIFDAGIQDPNCTDVRELTFLHAVTNTAMLLFDNDDLALTHSLGELAEDFGVSIVGDYFNAISVDVALTPAGCYVIPPGAPDTTEVALRIQTSIIPEIDAILAELETISDSPSDRFRIFFEPTETGLDNTLEVDYGEVLILKALLAGLKAQLEFKQAYNLSVDPNDPKVQTLANGLSCSEDVEVFINDFLSQYPDLFNVLPDGDIVLAQARQDLIDSINYYFAVINYIKSETDDQENDLVYIDPNDTAILDAVNENLTVLRNSLQNDTAGTYPVGTTKTYSINDGGSAIGQLLLTYNLTGLDGDSGILTFSNGTPSPWNVSHFELDDDSLMIEVEPGSGNGQSGGYFTATLSQDGNSFSNGTFEYWGAGVAPCDSVFYEVWAGNTDYCWLPNGNEYFESIDKYDYVKLGESDGQTKTFNGTYTYYCIAARKEFFLDSIQGSTGSYYSSGRLCTGNTSDWGNISGAPDGQYATVGYKPTLGTFRGYVVITNPGWNGITVISDRSCYDPVSLSGLSGQLLGAVVSNARFNLNPLLGGTTHYPNPVNPRDLLPEFDATNKAIPCTAGHGLGDDATLGGILPDMSQQDWFEECSAWEFGSIDGKTVKLTVNDSNGLPVTFSLTGGGHAEVKGTGFDEVILYGTTTKSMLKISTRGKTQTSVGSIICPGPLKAIMAKTTDLRGNITIGGSLGMLTLDDVADNHTITIGPSSNPKASTLMKFDQVRDLAINSEMPIKSLSATQWLGGSINAPWVGSISIKGDSKRGIVGSLDVDMDLDGTTAPKGVALKSVKVAGGILGGEWSIDGHCGSIQMANSDESFALHMDDYNIGSINAKGNKKLGIDAVLSGEFHCNSIKSVSALDIVDASFALEQKPDTKMYAIGKLSAKRWLDGCHIMTPGNVGSVSAGGMRNSCCFAGDVSTRDIEGLGGFPDGVLDLPDPAVDINYVKPATIKSIKIKGIKTEPPPYVINTNFAAAKILGAYLAYPDYDNDSVVFGIAADYIKSLKIKDADGIIPGKKLYEQVDAPDLPGDAEIRLY